MSKIKALIEHRGFLSIIDARNETHLVAASALKTPCSGGPATTYVGYRGGLQPIFINEPLSVVKAAIARARTLRRAQIKTSERRQMSFDFEDKP
jgi:hypothetical protein